MIQWYILTLHPAPWNPGKKCQKAWIQAPFPQWGYGFEDHLHVLPDGLIGMNCHPIGPHGLHHLLHEISHHPYLIDLQADGLSGSFAPNPHEFHWKSNELSWFLIPKSNETHCKSKWPPACQAQMIPPIARNPWLMANWYSSWLIADG